MKPRRARSSTSMRTVCWLSATILISGYAVAALGAEGKEPEGKLVFYSTSNTADTKAVTDSFKRLYPKVDVQFERTTDSQLMEKILTEARAGESRCGMWCPRPD